MGGEGDDGYGYGGGDEVVGGVGEFVPGAAEELEGALVVDGATGVDDAGVEVGAGDGVGDGVVTRG